MAALRIGLISDTHGFMNPKAPAALEGSAHILHAGDVGGEDILARLRQIAPVTAVRGNTDWDEWGRTLSLTEWVTFGGVNIFMLHDLAKLDLVPKAAGIGVVISGHTHQPKIERRDEVLYVNPGSAGPRRFTLPICVAMLTLEDGHAEARLIELEA